ncbi:aminotransferase class I/II-fold pyridoxal phosphate-dependent enzyme [bacterium]|nr:aminotransferase class I/II-fold pyridoxal phosphate-dependent enzyme [bacterium]
MDRIVDLRSDTVTKPTPKMREAMMCAEVGDDCYGEDPTVNELERLAAEKMGKEAAVYMPTGTMGNTASILAHTNLGDYIIVDSECHIYYYERGNMASLGGVMPIVMDSDDGCPDPDKVEPYLQRDITRFPKTSLVCLENTHNRRGGCAVSLERMKAIREVTAKYDRAVHLDGARIFNAAHALGVEAREIASYVDSVMFCLSKGLSAPVGSMVAGSAEFSQKARIARKSLGGGMRQAGVLAAAGIVALTEMTDRLIEDHENAQILAEGLSQIEALELDPNKFDTNIVIFDTKSLRLTAAEFGERAMKRGVKVSLYGPTTLRLVTNNDVSREDTLYAVDVLVDLMKEALS